jgi:hypothetical protein
MRALGRTVYRRLEWMELPLGPGTPLIDALVPVSHGFLDVSDTAEIALLRPALGAAGATRRLARGDRCFGTRYQGRLVSLTWISVDAARIEYLGLVVPLPAGVAFQHDRFTDPALRGRRIAPAAGSQLFRALADEGYGLLTGCVLRENEAAMANALRAGYAVSGTIGWIRLGPWRRAFRRPRAASGAAQAPVRRPEAPAGRTAHPVRGDESAQPARAQLGTEHG